MRKMGKINRIEIIFNSSEPPYSESDVIKDLINFFNLGDKLTPDVYITTAYGDVPEVEAYYKSGEMPEDLLAFVMMRALIKGIVKDFDEIGNLRVNPFKVRGTWGIMIIKEV